MVTGCKSYGRLWHVTVKEQMADNRLFFDLIEKVGKNLQSLKKARYLSSRRIQMNSPEITARFRIDFGEAHDPTLFIDICSASLIGVDVSLHEGRKEKGYSERNLTEEERLRKAGLIPFQSFSSSAKFMEHLEMTHPEVQALSASEADSYLDRLNSFIKTVAEMRP